MLSRNTCGLHYFAQFVVRMAANNTPDDRTATGARHDSGQEVRLQQRTGNSQVKVQQRTGATHHKCGMAEAMTGPAEEIEFLLRADIARIFPGQVLQGMDDFLDVSSITSLVPESAWP